MKTTNDNIVNIIFFTRCVEPRDPQIDLLGTLDKQLELVNQYGFKASFLLQYDTVLQNEYTSLIKQKLGKDCEVGGWFEIMQPLVEKAGIPWRGREGYAWDWHSDVGFSVGYTAQERMLLVDIFMEEFKDCFGYYPRSVGSWVIDAVTLAYMSDKYGIEASCNCRDQWGTDGYTLWGGYYGQGYYPSRKNMLCPAQTADKQIDVPVFRMLGSDPIYQYDLGLFDGDELKPSELQSVITLEPIYDQNGGGGDPSWVDWYFKENFAPGVSFNYTQVGQENPFGWDAMEKGLKHQFKQLEGLYKAGQVRIETLGETGRWYKKMFPCTPATSINGLTDWQNKGRKTLWYESRFYRVNFFEENGLTWIRDIHKFDEAYEERYLTSVCEGHLMTFDNLPVIDGNRWSYEKIRAGIYPSVCGLNGRIVRFAGTLSVEYPGDNRAKVCIKSEDEMLTIICEENRLIFSLETERDDKLVLELCDGAGKLRDTVLEKDRICYRHNGFNYSVQLGGTHTTERTNDGMRITAQSKELTLIFS